MDNQFKITSAITSYGTSIQAPIDEQAASIASMDSFFKRVNVISLDSPPEGENIVHCQCQLDPSLKQAIDHTRARSVDGDVVLLAPPRVTISDNWSQVYAKILNNPAIGLAWVGTFSLRKNEHASAFLMPLRALNYLSNRIDYNLSFSNPEWVITVGAWASSTFMGERYFDLTATEAVKRYVKPKPSK